MAEVIHFPPKVQTNKPRPRDHADVVAIALIGAVIEHIEAHWDDKTGPFDLPALGAKIASTLRTEFGHSGRSA
jgi:hypothetical protein